MDILGVISETPFFDPFFRNDQNGWKVPLMRDHYFGSDRDPKKGVQKWSKIGHFWDPKIGKNGINRGIGVPGWRQNHYKWHFCDFRDFLSFFDKKMTKSSKNRTRFFRSKSVQPKNVKNDQKHQKCEKLHILIN